MSSYGTLSFSRRQREWVITTTPDVTMRIKRIFPRITQRRGTELAITETPEVANDLEWVLQRFPLKCAHRSRLRRVAREYRQARARMATLRTSPPPGASFNMALPPRDYQSLGTSLYLEQGHLLLADVVGLGKTVAAIASFTDRRTIPALVVVKAHLPQQWVDEIKKFLPDYKVHVIQKKEYYYLPAAHVYIISYPKLASWWGHLAKLVQSLVLDECQEVKSQAAGKYEAAKGLADCVPFRLGLSATPISNYGPEYWAVMNLIAPDALGSENEFQTEWCSKNQMGKLVITEPEAFGHYLRNENLILRRTRKEVGRELPKITRFVQDVEFDTKIYEAGLSAAEELARIALSGTFIERGQASRAFDLRLRQATGLAKAPYVAEFTRMLVESGEPVLLGGWHRSVYDIWNQRLADLHPVMFTGSESPAQKERAKRDFMDGKTKVMMMCLRSGAGTNGLQEVCSTAVIGEFDWAPSVLDQFVGRIARDGQDSPISVFVPVAPVGSDPTMAEVLGIKKHQAMGILDPGEDIDLDMVETDQARVKQLAIDFLRSRGKPIPVEALADPASLRPDRREYV